VPIRVPALRDRPEDIPLLFRKFASDFAERYCTQSVQLDPGALQLLVSYGWRGNVRELKNIAEQVSVLSEDKNITADALTRFLPVHDSSRSLALRPAGQMIPGQHTEEFSTTERDILYKLFFDLKKYINELKQIIFEMAHGRGFSLPPVNDNLLPVYNNAAEPAPGYGGSTTPFVIQPQDAADHNDEVEESLMLADREKEFIIKALKKHKSRRRDAANELGISERTLYRKIKEYGIDE